MIQLANVKASSIQESVSNEDLAFLMPSGYKDFHERGYKGQGVTVAVVDSGVAPHPEFGDRLLDGIGFTYYTSSSMDDSGHGTHVAATIAGATCGVAPEARILPVKVIAGGMGASRISDLILGLKWVQEWRDDNGNPVDIINMSLSTPEYSEELKTVIDELVASGVAVICSAGNNGNDEPVYPSHFESPIVVGSVSQDMQRSYFSNYHKDLDFVQIGENVISAYYHGGYISMTGTSMATPIVSGLAALLMCEYKSRTGKKMPEPLLYETLKKYSKDINEPGRDYYTGYGFATLDRFFEHWAEKYYAYLNSIGIVVHEKRFDEPITRGEVMALIARAKGYVD